MANKQIRAYCRIIDYVDAVNPKLAEIIRLTCSDMALSSLKRKPGITFLLPTDKEFLAKLEKLAQSEKAEEVIKAGDLINALIIRDVFKSPMEWKAREVSNSLLPPQIIEVESTSGSNVIFKSKAIATIDPNFKDASRKQNLAVWELKGEIPITTDKPAQNVPMKHKIKGRYTGNYDPGNIQSQSNRFKIALAVENTYALQQLQRQNNTVIHVDIYLETSLSLIHYIKHILNNVSLLYERVLPVISFDKVDFYFLVEPHKISGQYLLADNVIYDWWAARNTLKCNPNDVMADVQKMLSAGQNALVYTDRQSILAKIDILRQQISQTVDSRPRSCVEPIEKIYKELETSNTINGLGPIYPDSLAQYYKSEPGLKMIQDELRFLTFGAFSRLEKDGFDYGSFHEIVNTIGECLYPITESDRLKNQRILNGNTIKYLISPSESILEIKIFVNSTMFLYIPLTKSEADGLQVKNRPYRPNPSNIVVFNIAKNLYAQHQRLIAIAPNQQEIVNAILSLNIETLDPILKEELKQKLNA